MAMFHHLIGGIIVSILDSILAFTVEKVFFMRLIN
jgi:hypothetical protein